MSRSILPKEEEKNNNEIVLNIYKKFKKMYINEEFVIDKNGGKLLEILNASFNLNPNYPVIDLSDSVGRKTPLKYAKKEIDWYISQSLFVNDISGKVPEIWKQISDKDGKINSNYGYLVFSEENCNQYNNCVVELIKNKDSRRAIMIYSRPNIWNDYKKNNMNDFICTLANQFFIRNNKLISIYTMRSNDFTFGFYNDFYWACYIYNKLYLELKEVYTELEIGHICWNANSLHLYEKHFKYLK